MTIEAGSPGLYVFDKIKALLLARFHQYGGDETLFAGDCITLSESSIHIPTRSEMDNTHELPLEVEMKLQE
jgi:hypothetical protein